MSKYIYFVGKPYPHVNALNTIRRSNYKIGIFLDKNKTIHHRDAFDKIIEIDFSSSQSILEGVAGRNLQVDGLICTYENYVVAKSYIAEYFKLPVSSLLSAKASTDKYLMRKAFMKADPLITPRFDLVSTEKELLEAAHNLTYPLILKPTNLVKSLLVLRCNDEAELLSNFAYARHKITGLYEKYNIYGRQPQIIVEEYIEGKTCSIAAFVDKTGTPHFCDGIVSLTNAQDISVDDNYIYGRFLPAEFNKSLETQLFQTASKGIAALDMTSTAAHVELIYGDQGVKLIEIGARIGGYRPKMYEMSYGLDLIGQEIKLALGETPDLSGGFRAYSAVYELFPKGEGEFINIAGAVDTSRFELYKIKAKKGDLVGPAKKGYKATAVVIVSNHDKREFSQICKSVDKLKVEINK